MADFVSLRKFSRARGVALSAVQKAIRDGRVHGAAVKRDGDRIVGIDRVLATEQWNANTDPTQAARSGQVFGAPAPAVQASGLAEPLELKADDREVAGAEKPAAADKDPHGYYEARAKREQAQAEMAELDLLEQRGLLVSVEEMRLIAARRYRALRDQVLNVPDRVSSILAAERDPARVHALLTAELKRVLHGLSDDAAAEVARGVAERVAA